MHPSRISVPDEERGKSPTYPSFILVLGCKSLSACHKTCGARTQLCSPPLLRPDCCTCWFSSLAASAVLPVFALPCCLSHHPYDCFPGPICSTCWHLTHPQDALLIRASFFQPLAPSSRLTMLPECEFRWGKVCQFGLSALHTLQNHI